MLHYTEENNTIPWNFDCNGSESSNMVRSAEISNHLLRLLIIIRISRIRHNTFEAKPKQMDCLTTEQTEFWFYLAM